MGEITVETILQYVYTTLSIKTYIASVRNGLVSQILQIPLGLEWFRMANKYLENLNKISTSDYGTVTVIRDEKDEAFVAEFDYLSSRII